MYMSWSTSHHFPICAPELPMSDEEGERGRNFPTDETREDNGTYRKSRNSYIHLIYARVSVGTKYIILYSPIT